MLSHLLAMLNSEVSHSINRACKTKGSRDFVQKLLSEGIAGSDMNNLCDKPENQSIDDVEFNCAMTAKSLRAIDDCHLKGMAQGDASQSVDQLDQAIVQACAAAEATP